MLRSWAERLVQATTASRSKSRWRRNPGDYLVKTARLTDGEVIHILIGRSTTLESAEDGQFYKAFQDVRTQTLKVAVWMVGSCAFGILVHFKGLLSASSNGLVVSSFIFSHAALLSMSASFSWFCFLFSKQSYLQSWFIAKMRNGSPSLKTTLLLKYPDAFYHFQFLPASIGYPENMYARKSGYGQLFSIFFVIVILIGFSIGSWMLWLTVAMDVWFSNKISELGTIVTLILSVALILMGLTSPFRGSWPKQYKHHGLTNQLTKLQGDSLNRAHMRIYAAARRMGLIELS